MANDLDDPPSHTNEDNQSQKSAFVDGDSKGELIPSKVIARDETQLDGAGREALENIVGSLTVRQSTTGPAAMISAIAQLPESTQLAQLKLEEERLKSEVGLEKHRIDVMARDRSEERATQSTRYQIDKSQEQRTELLQYSYVAVVSAVLLALVVYLFLDGKSQVATPILTAALGLGAGWVGGRGTGYAKAQREQKLQKSDE